MFKTGDTVCCKEDIVYLFKGTKKVIKKGYSMIIKAVIGDEIVVDRFGKPFILKKDQVEKKST
jgi:hypothetical protein